MKAGDGEEFAAVSNELEKSNRSFLMVGVGR